MRSRYFLVLLMVMALSAGAWAGDPMSLEASPVDSTTVTNFNPDMQTDDAGGPPYFVPAIGWDIDGLCVSSQSGYPGVLTHYWGPFDDSLLTLTYSPPTCAGVWWSDGFEEPVAPLGEADEWLISPSVDCTGTTNLNLSFWSAYTMPSYLAAATSHDYVQVSTDGGSTWAVVGDLSHDAAFEFPTATGGIFGAGWNGYDFKINIALTAYNGEADVRFAFNYVSTDGAAPRGVWMVDDVTLQDGLATLLFEDMDGTWIQDPDYVLLLPPSDLTCTENGADVDLAWTNNDTYDSIDVYEDGVAIANITGSDTTYTVAGVVKGGHCYHVCGVAGAIEACSDTCCLVFGFDNVEVLWDFEAGDGGFVVDGTGGWEHGAPTFGPCFDTADGNVWATDLDADYPVNACWLLDSAPILIEADKGGFVCFDHCYDTEATYDGGVVWFTTDDFWYYNWAPLGGGVSLVGANACQWVSGFDGFSGSSDGWVTDCWDFTDPEWYGQDIKIRFAFGSDVDTNGSGWMIDNVTVYNNAAVGTIDCSYIINPLSGTVPFGTIHRVEMINLYTGTRRIAGRIRVDLANGTFINPWKAGFTNVLAGSSFISQFPVNIPAIVPVIGSNTFKLSSEDVTPAPFNQPPFPPSGDTCTETNVVVANAP